MVYSFNEPSIRMHEKLGFVFEVRLRCTVYTNGRHYDTIYFGLTKEEFDLLDPVAELWEDERYVVSSLFKPKCQAYHADSLDKFGVYSRIA